MSKARLCEGCGGELATKRSDSRYCSTQCKDREKCRRHREANPEKWREYGRRYRESNREKLRAKARLYYEANHEELQEKRRRHNKENQEDATFAKRNARRRAQRATAKFATRNRQPWASWENEILRDETLTVVDQALTLRRTQTAIRERRTNLRKQGLL